MNSVKIKIRKSLNGSFSSSENVLKGKNLEQKLTKEESKNLLRHHYNRAFKHFANKQINNFRGDLAIEKLSSLIKFDKTCVPKYSKTDIIRIFMNKNKEQREIDIEKLVDELVDDMAKKQSNQKLECLAKTIHSLSRLNMK